MVQPGNPYGGQEYGGPEYGGQQQPWGQPAPPAQDPWGQQPSGWDQPAQPQPGGWDQPTQPQPGAWDQPAQQTQPMPVQPGGWGQPPQSPPYGSPDPYSPAPYGSPDPYGWQGQGGGGMPPQPPKSSTGLVVGIIGAVVVLLLILVVGGWYLLQEEEKPPVANPNPDASASASASPSASPSPTGKQPSDLDDKDTDTTPLDPDHMFPSSSFTGDGGSYTLAAVLETDACKGVGGSKVRDLLRRYDCGDMVLGVYLDEDEKLFSSLLVIPLATADDADDAESDLLADKQDYIDALTYYCPADGKPGADQCKRTADDPAAWYASFQAFHRYLLVSITLYTDGHRTDNLDRINEMSNDILVHVKEAMLSD